MAIVEPRGWFANRAAARKHRMRAIKGPGLFIAQYIDADTRLTSLSGLARWASELGFKGLQAPTWHSHIFDLETAASSQAYCDDVLGQLKACGLQSTELTSRRETISRMRNPPARAYRPDERAGSS